MRLDETNRRRFRHQEGVAVLAVYDNRRCCTLYGEVCHDDHGRLHRPAFCDDEIEELR